MPPKKNNEDVKDVSSSFAMIVLLVGLGLSALNLWYMTDRSGTLAGVLSSMQSLQANYGSRLAPPPSPPKPEIEPVARQPVVLWSVAKYRDGEEASLQLRLVVPLLVHYSSAENAPKAVLIERKNPGSKDVNVRLFFTDGSETSYLWPSTHSNQDGVWTIEE